MNTSTRTNLNRVFLARLAGTAVFDPNGDQLGKVRDAVATLRSNNQPPRILGFIVEVPPRKRIFVPITRVNSIDNGHVIITGLLNMRRFEPRANEITVLAEMLDRSVTLIENDEKVTVEDVAMELSKTGDWFIEHVHVTKRGSGFRKRGASSTVNWTEISGIHIPEGERAADVLEEMDPDDAADLLREVGKEKAQALLALMEPEDAEDVQRLMDYEDYSAGGMMTTEPIVLTADSTVAEALSRVRLSEVSPGLASQVFICRQPIETPTGRLLGVVHIQRLLREPPATLLGGVLDTDIAPLLPEATLSEVSSYLASYNLLAVPIVDSNERLLGVVTVDDVLDHLLPENWRHFESLKRESETN